MLLTLYHFQGPSARLRRVRAILSGTRVPCYWESHLEVSEAKGAQVWIGGHQQEQY